MLCPECQKLSAAEYVAGVNSRRIAPIPFSASEPIRKKDEWHFGIKHREYEFKYGENLCETYRPLKELVNVLYEQFGLDHFPHHKHEEDREYLIRLIRALNFVFIETGELNTPDATYWTNHGHRPDKHRLYRINTQNLSLVVLCEKEYTEEEMKHLLHFHKLPIRKLFE
jgi:hypothetical protein